MLDLLQIWRGYVGRAVELSFKHLVRTFCEIIRQNNALWRKLLLGVKFFLSYKNSWKHFIVWFSNKYVDFTKGPDKLFKTQLNCAPYVAPSDLKEIQHLVRTFIIIFQWLIKLGLSAFYLQEILHFDKSTMKNATNLCDNIQCWIQMDNSKWRKWKKVENKTKQFFVQ